MNKLSLNVKDLEQLLPIMKKNSLATVIAYADNQLVTCPLPLVSEFKDNKLTIYGHLSTRNPLAKHLKIASEITILFHGPNTYINSSWYQVDDVSTWNYITVQASGKPATHEDHASLIDILKKTTALANENYTDQWDFNIPSDLQSENELQAAIMGFSLTPTNISGRFKLSQSKSAADQRNIIAELEKRTDSASHQIGEFMTKNFKD